jgi:hypothetical protein
LRASLDHFDSQPSSLAARLDIIEASLESFKIRHDKLLQLADVLKTTRDSFKIRRIALKPAKAAQGEENGNP